MPRVFFTPNLRRHIGDADGSAPGATVREVLERLFEEKPHARGYVLDDQGAVRRHMNIVVCGRPIRDRALLSDPVPEDGSIYVIQALSGG